MIASKSDEPKSGSGDFNSLLKDVPKDALKSIFHLIFGKPDSIVKTYSGPFVVLISDIEILSNQILNKLNNHDVSGISTTVTVACSNNMNYEFKDWIAFIKHPWSIPETSEAIALKWDFMVKLPNYDQPQPHAITLRISSGAFSLHFIQAIFSKNPDDIDQADKELSPMFCRVDFINAILSEEIINIIDSWYKTLKKPDFCFSPFWSLKRYHSKLQKTIRLSFPIIFILGWAWAFVKFTSKAIPTDPITFLQLKFFAFWLFISFFSVSATSQIGRSIADKIHHSLSRAERHRTIEITSGDKNKQNELKKNNQNSIWKSAGYILLSIILNCVSAGLSYWITKLF